jgi:hypothetical protein
MKNRMLTLVAAECVLCGSTAETVKGDRLVGGGKNALCCHPRPRSFTDPGFPGSEPAVTFDGEEGARARREPLSTSA